MKCVLRLEQRKKSSFRVSKERSEDDIVRLINFRRVGEERCSDSTRPPRNEFTGHRRNAAVQCYWRRTTLRGEK